MTLPPINLRRRLPVAAGIAFIGLTVSLAGCNRTAPDRETADPATTDVERVGEDPAPGLSLPPDGAERTAEGTGRTDPPGEIDLPADFDPDRPVTRPQADDEGYALPPIPQTSLPASTEHETLTGTGADAPPAADQGADEGKVELIAAELPEIESRVTKTGRLTVVDFWSLACEPCLKEFPGLVELHKEHGDRVACFSVDVDYDGRRTKPAESYRPRVEEFLKSVNATFPNYLSETPSDDVFEALKIDSIPAVVIYDASGKKIRTFSDVGEDAGFTYDDNVIPFVKEQLAKDR